MFAKHEDKNLSANKIFPQAASSGEESDTSVGVLQRKNVKTTIPPKRPTVPEHPVHKKPTRSTSTESSSSTESSASSAVRNTVSAHATDEAKPKYGSRGNTDTTSEPTRTRSSSTSSNTSKTSTPQKPFQSRFLHSRTPSVPATPTPTKEEEEESSSEEETDSEEESEEETEKTNKDMSKTDIGPLLARSALVRDSSESSPTKVREEPTYGRSRYTKEDDTPVNSYSRTRATAKEDEPSYPYTSRFVNKSKSSPGVQDEDDRTKTDDTDKYSTAKSRYSALKDRRQRLARSKSSHTFGDDDETDEPISPTTANPTAYLQSRGYSSATSSGNDLARSRSTHALKSRESSPDRSTGAEKDGAALSSWARYLKNKYGNRSSAKDKDTSTTASSPSASSSSAARRLSLGLPLRSSDVGSSDDDQKNMRGSPTTPTVATVAAAGKLT